MPVHVRSHWKVHKQVCGKSGGTQEEVTGNATETQKSAETLLPPNLDQMAFSPEKEKGEEIGEIQNDHDRFTENFESLKKSAGLGDPQTLAAAFDLINSWIGLYRLEPCDAMITEVMPVCESMGIGGEWHIKAIQARAFLRYKQHRFRDALADFLEFNKYAGSSAELRENMGHTYNTLGDYDNAEKCFLESLALMDRPGAPAKASANRGGVLLGLGLVKERLGRVQEGLDILFKALEFYKARFKGAEHSLVAKTLMSVGHAQEKLGQLGAGGESYREAVRIFKFTCGDDTPLTANALDSLAKNLYAQSQSTEPPCAEKVAEARERLLESFVLYTGFDTLNVYMQNIIDILNEAKRWAIESKEKPPPGSNTLSVLHAKFRPFVPAIIQCQQRVQKEPSVDSGTAAVYYKVGGEICMLSGDYALAVPMLNDAVAIFETVTEVDCTRLIAECRSMLAFTGAESAS